MTLITGDYCTIKRECDRLFENDYFDFSLLYVDEINRFRELDRFLYESKHLLRFENEYHGKVVIDLSDWNHRPINEYFKAFLYYLKDNADRFDCILLLNDIPCSEMLEFLTKLIPDMERVHYPQNASKIKMGFVSDVKEA